MLTRLITALAILALTSEGIHARPGAIREYASPKPAPPIEIFDINDRHHSLPDYRDKVLIVSFWASWCAPCLKEMPSLERAARHLSDADIRILLVNMGESRKDIEAFRARFPVTLPLLLDEDGTVSSDWSVIALPTAFIVDTRGMITHRVVGGIEWDDQEIMDKLKIIRRAQVSDNSAVPEKK